MNFMMIFALGKILARLESWPEKTLDENSPQLVVAFDISENKHEKIIVFRKLGRSNCAYIKTLKYQIKQRELELRIQ